RQTRGERHEHRHGRGWCQRHRIRRLRPEHERNGLGRVRDQPCGWLRDVRQRKRRTSPRRGGLGQGDDLRQRGRDDRALLQLSFLTGSAASNPPCGFTVYHFQVGAYRVDFGFQVSDRFFSVSPAVDSAFQDTAAQWQLGGVTFLNIYMYKMDGGLDYTNGPFMLLVY